MSLPIRSSLKRYKPKWTERLGIGWHWVMSRLAAFVARTTIEDRPRLGSDRFHPRCTACGEEWPEYPESPQIWSCPECGKLDAQTLDADSAALQMLFLEQVARLEFLEATAKRRKKDRDVPISTRMYWGRIESAASMRRWDIEMAEDRDRYAEMTQRWFQSFNRILGSMRSSNERMREATSRLQDLNRRLNKLEPWWKPLGQEPGSLDEARHLYRKQLQTAHPDRGGTAEEFRVLRAAYDRARARLN